MKKVTFAIKTDLFLGNDIRNTITFTPTYVKKFKSLYERMK